MHMGLKKQLINQYILLTLTYGCESCTFTDTVVKRLKVYQRAKQWQILGVSLRVHLRNEESRRKTKVVDVGQQIS